MLDEDLALAYLGRAGIGPEQCLGIARSLDIAQRGGRRRGLAELHGQPGHRGARVPPRRARPAARSTSCARSARWRRPRWRGFTPRSSTGSPSPARSIPRLTGVTSSRRPSPISRARRRSLLRAYLEVVGVRPDDSYSAQVTEDDARDLSGVSRKGLDHAEHQSRRGAALRRRRGSPAAHRRRACGDRLPRPRRVRGGTRTLGGLRARRAAGRAVSRHERARTGPRPGLLRARRPRPVHRRRGRRVRLRRGRTATTRSRRFRRTATAGRRPGDAESRRHTGRIRGDRCARARSCAAGATRSGWSSRCSSPVPGSPGSCLFVAEQFEQRPRSRRGRRRPAESPRSTTPTSRRRASTARATTPCGSSWTACRARTRRETIVAATNCMARFENGGSARFRGARQGASVTIGDRATVGTFDAPAGAVAAELPPAPVRALRKPSPAERASAPSS